MARFVATRIAYLKWLIIYATMSSWVDGLDLNLSTSKPRHTKFSGSTTEPGSGALATPSTGAPTKDNSGVALYRYVNGKTSSTCILFRTDAVVEVTFKLHNLEEKADSFIPKDALIEGNCRDEDFSFMRISWTGYSLIINFAKTPGGERWYISKLELTVSPDLPQIHGLKTNGKSAIKLYHRQMLIPTPVGKSYACDELDVELETDADDHPPPGVRGSVLFRLLRLQPFMFKGEDFEPAFECKSQQSFRDETAPIAVGSTLAIAVLVTVAAYGVYRYFKVKNVQYNTME